MLQSELDENRRKFILSKIDKRQVIITSCEPIDFASVDDINFIEISDGKRIFEIQKDEASVIE